MKIKNIIETISHSLLSISLIIGIGIYIFQGIDLINSQTQINNAKSNYIKSLEDLYINEISSVTKEINEIDARLKEFQLNGIPSQNNLLQLRELKSKDKLELMKILGEQLTRIKTKK